jgi:predicted polyphosphate/ATP-dependent NAD kinase
LTTTQGSPVKTIGFIVNPVAGMGGAVGLKGTDGKEILTKALSLGAKPLAGQRAEAFLLELSPIKDKILLLSGAGEMGENEAQKSGFNVKAVGQKKPQTTPEDTKEVAKAILDAKVDLLVFCGGDGTARDILGVVGMQLPVLGVPTGVKMHSSIFAVNPLAAARVAFRFLNGELPLREAEVMDVDENAFRKGRLSAELYGYILSPYEPTLIQANKLASPMTEDEVRNQAAIAVNVIESMKPETLYIVGPGTTTRTISDLLDQKKTLLGVDLFLDKKNIASDVNETQIIQAIQDKKTEIIVTPIGGQGFLFGRGNQQISAKIICQVGLDNIIVIASKAKLHNLKSLKVDTGDAKLDDAFRARKIQVLVDYKIYQEMPVE